jgi:hypothetical protein
MYKACFVPPIQIDVHGSYMQIDTYAQEYVGIS